MTISVVHISMHQLQKTKTAPSLTMRHARTLLFATVAAAALVGCSRYPGAPPPSYAFTDPTIRFPITVAHERQIFDVNIGSGKDGISDFERSQIRRFLSQYRRYGNGMLIIAIPARHNRTASESFAWSELRDIVENQGIPPSEISMSNAPRSGFGRSQISLSYYRETAQSPPCGTWPTNLAETRQNVPYQDLGCSQRNNLAAMVSNPSDFTRVPAMSERFAPRRDVIFDKYTKGELGKKKGKGKQKGPTP